MFKSKNNITQPSFSTYITFLWLKFFNFPSLWGWRSPLLSSNGRWAASRSKCLISISMSHFPGGRSSKAKRFTLIPSPSHISSPNRNGSGRSDLQIWQTGFNRRLWGLIRFFLGTFTTYFNVMLNLIHPVYSWIPLKKITLDLNRNFPPYNHEFVFCGLVHCKVDSIISEMIPDSFFPTSS